MISADNDNVLLNHGELRQYFTLNQPPQATLKPPSVQQFLQQVQTTQPVGIELNLSVSQDSLHAQHNLQNQSVLSQLNQSSQQAAPQIITQSPMQHFSVKQSLVKDTS